MEPLPENVAGEVVETHAFEHRVDWGHVVLGAAAIYVVWKASSVVDQGNDEEGAGHTGG
jgi:hypothetical protein